MRKLKYTFIVALLLLASIVKSQNSIAEPEYSSFEPVDATDMVNLVTGDFTYVLPLLNIPSPEGGYPISLSYHGGIAMDQEASWVGLGWNINTGALNRTIMGFPDDWKGKRSDVAFYAGGIEEKDYDASLSVHTPVGNVSLSASWGTYKSLGGSITYGWGISRIGKDPLSISITAGTEGMGVGIGMVDINQSYDGTSRISVGVGGMSLGYSLSSNYSGGYYSTPIGGGLINANISSPGDVSADTKGFYAMIPIPYTPLTADFKYTKYTLYSYNQMFKQVWGTIYSSESHKNIESWGKQDLTMFSDSYVNPYDIDIYKEPLENEWQNSLSFLNYDQYIVACQGLAGKITPRIFDFGTLVRGGYVTKRNEDLAPKDQYLYNNRYNFNSDPLSQVHFTFDNQNSSYQRRKEVSSFEGFDSGDPIWDWSVNGKELVTSYNGESNYDSDSRRHGGGKYIEWFTNKDIRDGIAESKGFIEDDNMYIERRKTLTEFNNDFDADGIGGFMITSEDGKTYHFSIPVYHFENYNIQEKKSNKDNEYKMERKTSKYAYTWLLTAITGPDYIDRGGIHNTSNGIIDENDWGYWVKFNSGKWTDGYVWRDPYIGYNKGADSDYGTYSIGRKQIYYLNSIETRTHIAYFIKNIREDGLGKDGELKKEGYNGQKKLYYSGIDEYDIIDFAECEIATGNMYLYTSNNSFEFTVSEKHKKLNLEKIILLNKKDNINVPIESSIDIITPSIDNTIDNSDCSVLSIKDMLGYTVNDYTCCKEKIEDRFGNAFTETFTMYNPDEVLDINDISVELTNSMEDKALKIIEFNHDYSLCPGNPSSNASNGGKLTLNKVEIKGKGNTNIMPSYIFDYYKLGSNSFDVDRKDDWGYDEINPQNWSLKEITTPIGSKINIEYESDKYSIEAVFNGIYLRLNEENCTWSISDSYGSNQATLTVTVDPDVPNIENALSNIISNCRIRGDAEIEHRYVCINLSPEYYCEDDIYITGTENWDKNLSLYSVDPSQRILIFKIDKNDSPDYGNPLTYAEGQNFYPVVENLVVTLLYNGSTAEINGGGVRVSSIIMETATEEYKSVYNYNNPVTGNNSGVTSYSPKDIDDKFIPYIHEIPGPGIMYEYVTVENNGINGASIGKTQYHFEVLDPSTNTYSYEFKMGDHFEVEDLQHESADPRTTSDGYIRTLHIRSSVIHDKTASLGTLKGKKVYNTEGQIIYKKDLLYQIPDDGIGIIQETVNDIRQKVVGYYDNNFYITSSSRKKYPIFLSEVSEISNSLKTSEYYSDFDFNTGIPLTTITELPDEKFFKTEILPAYKIAAYNNMGSKVGIASNKNMLSQQAASLSYIKNGETWNPIGVSIQTWNDEWNYREFRNGNYIDELEDDIDSIVWRKHKQFVWKGYMESDGTYGIDFNTYSTPDGLAANWNDLETVTDKWQQVNEITRYNHYSAPLESKDINGHFASAKMDINSEKTLASVANASYKEFAFTGFEGGELRDAIFEYGNEIFGGTYCSQVESVPEGIEAHTGDYLVSYIYEGPYYESVYDPIKDNGIKPGRTYVASAWVHEDSDASTELKLDLIGNVNLSESVLKNHSSAIKFGEWILLNVNLTIPGDFNTGKLKAYLKTASQSTLAYIDDFRVHPIDAPMQSFVYDKHTGAVTAILDNNNIATKYEYDDAGKLKYVYKETPGGFKKVSEHNYGYARVIDETIPLPDILEVNPSGLIFDRISGTQSFTITTEVDWTITKEPGSEWIGIDTMSGSGNATINVTCGFYTTLRDGDFYINYAGISKRFHVTQDPGDIPLE